MQTSDQEHEVNVFTRSYTETLSTVPIKKRRRFMLAESPSPPDVSSSLPANIDVPQDNPEPSPPDVSSSLPANIDVPQDNPEPESFVSEAFRQSASGTTLTRKDLNQPAHHKDLTGPMLQGFGPNISGRGTQQARGSTPALLPVTGVTPDVLQDNSEPESFVSEALSQPASGTTLTTKNLNQPAHHEDLPGPMLQGLGPDTSGRETQEAKESTPALPPVTGITQLLSTKEPVKLSVSESHGEQDGPTETTRFPIVSENVKSQLAFKDPCVNGQNSENISSKQEKSDSCSQNLPLDAREHSIQSKSKDGESKIESSLICRDAQAAKESTPTLLPVTGVTQLLSTKEPVELSVSEGHGEQDVPTDTSWFPIVSENVKFQLAIEDRSVKGQNSENVSSKQEKSDSCSQNLSLDTSEQNLQSKLKDGESKIESSDTCMDRFNWDLNTPMDAWPDMLNDSVDDSGADRRNLVVGCTQDINLSLSPVQMVNKESDGTVETVGRFILGKNAGPSGLSNTNSSPESCLDLQLKPSSAAESFFKYGSACPLGKVDSTKGAPLLSLSVKPLPPCPSSGNSKPVACRDVKAEPHDGSCQMNSKDESCSLKSTLQHVKPEPCERRESLQRTCPSDPKSSCAGAVKAEAHDDCSQGYLGKKNMLLTTQSTEIPLNVAEHACQAFESWGSGSNLLQKCMPLPVAITLELVTQAPTDDNNEIRPEGNILITESNLVQKLISNDKKLSLFKEPSKLDGLASPPPKPSVSDIKERTIANVRSETVARMLISDDKKLSVFEEPSKLASPPSKPSVSDFKEHMAANVKSETVAQMCSPGVTSADELTIDTFQNDDQASEICENKIELAAEVHGKSSDSEMESNNAQFVAGTLNTVRTSELNNSHVESGVVDAAVYKRRREDNDFEDGELLDVALHGTTEVLCEERGRKQLEDADLVCPTDVPVESLFCTDDPKEDKTENAEDSTTHNSETGNDSQSCHTDELGISTITKLHDESTDGVPMTDSVKKRLGKSFRKTPQVQLKDKGPGGKLNSVRALGVMTVREGTHDEVSSQQTDNLPYEIPLSHNDGTTQNDEGNSSRIIDLKKGPASDGFTLGKEKFFSGRSLRAGNERFTGNWLKLEKSRSQKFRDENFRYKSGAFDRSRNTNQHAGRHRSNMMFNSSRLENQNTNEMISEREHVLEQVVNSPGSRFARRGNASEVAPAATSDGPTGNGGRMKRKLTDDEQQNRSHNSFRGRMPNRGGRIPAGNRMMIHHRTKDVSPSGYTGRDDPDFALRAQEERLMRTLPDGRMVPLVSRACPHYEMENELTRRERSISPINRRGPLQFPESSPRSQQRNHCQWSPPRRSQQRNHCQWSPPRRSAEGFNGSPELLRCTPYFADDMVVRRRGSPPYNSDIRPSRERDFPRSARGMQRNVQRFDMFDSPNFREECFPEEFDGNDEFVDSHERRGVRPFGQCDARRDDVNETFHSHGGPPGPFRFCHDDNDGFVERGIPGDYERHVRNRLGGRMRDLDEQDNRLGGRMRDLDGQDDYRYRGEPGWRDAGIGDGRLKRRRVERH